MPIAAFEVVAVIQGHPSQRGEEALYAADLYQCPKTTDKVKGKRVYHFRKEQRDSDKTYSLAPEKWQRGRRLAPSTNDSAPKAFRIPPILHDLGARFVIQATECGDRGVPNRAQVIASLKGLPMSAFLTKQRVLLPDWHIQAFFHNFNGLARVRFNRDNLTIDCQALEITDEHLITRTKLIARLKVDIAAVTLPDSLKRWQPAVIALEERLRCKGCRWAHFAR